MLGGQGIRAPSSLAGSVALVVIATVGPEFAGCGVGTGAVTRDLANMRGPGRITGMAR